MALQNQINSIPGRRQVNKSVVMGDLTGNTRGDSSVDIQSSRTDIAQVAAGNVDICLGSYNQAGGTGHSIAVGTSNIANGGYSLAFGNGNNCNTNTYAVAIGNYNTSSAYISFCFGHGNSTTGSKSSAIGVFNAAGGTISCAAGYYNSAAGNYQSLIGLYNRGTAAALSAISFGIGNNAQGVSIDRNTGAVIGGALATETTIGIRSMAVGITNKTSANNCCVFGHEISGNISGTVMLGINNLSRMIISGSGTVTMSGLATSVTTETLNYNATASDSIIIMDINADRTLRLPNAIGNRGRMYTVKNIGAANRTVTVSSVIGGQTIDGAASDVISGNYLVQRYVSDNANWFKV